jgi:hypothetical protein
MWLNTQQVRCLGLAGSSDDDDDDSSGGDDDDDDDDSSSGGDNDDSGVDEGVKCSEKECWEDIVVEVEYSKVIVKKEERRTEKVGKSSLISERVRLAGVSVIKLRVSRSQQCQLNNPLPEAHNNATYEINLK